MTFVIAASVGDILVLLFTAVIVVGAIAGAVLYVRSWSAPEEPTAKKAHTGPRWHSVDLKWVLAVGAVVLLVAAWSSGTFDRALVHVGLNAKQCGQNAFGATYCGDELKQYKQNVVDPIQKANDDAQDQAAQEQQIEQREQQKYEQCMLTYSGQPNLQATC